MALAGRRMAQEPRHDIPGIKDCPVPGSHRGQYTGSRSPPSYSVDEIENMVSVPDTAENKGMV